MASKATIERLVQLQRAVTGKPTTRPITEILKSERSVAANYTPPTIPAAPEPLSGQFEARE